MDYFYDVVIFVAIYAALAVSLNLLAGYTGMLSMAHAVYFGIGAYLYAIWSRIDPLNSIGVCACTVFAAAALGLIIGYAGIRTRGDYFALSTLALQVVASSIFNNWDSVTSGPMGITNVEPLRFGSWIARSESN